MPTQQKRRQPGGERLGDAKVVHGLVDFPTKREEVVDSLLLRRKFLSQEGSQVVQASGNRVFTDGIAVADRHHV